uniref:Uncharacterized protein n=1 Tax=Panagrolaimus sp. ES5 TaxID=591445 RepID=A0AC34GAF7_9BILA
MDLHKELYPSLFTKECENNPNIIVVYRIRGSKKIGYRIIEAKTEKLIEDQLIGIEINDFLKNVSFKNVKAVIFNISDHDREVSDVDYDVKMREKIATVLRSIKVPYLFVNDKTFAAMNALMCATIVPKIDERILAITILINKFSIIELLRKNNGYEIIERREIKCDKEDTNFKKLRSDILGKNAPAKIIVTSLLPVFMHPEIMEKLKNHILNSEFLIICDDEHVFTEKSDKNMLKIPCAVVRNLYDPNYTKQDTLGVWLRQSPQVQFHSTTII